MWGIRHTSGMWILAGNVLSVQMKRDGNSKVQSPSVTCRKAKRERERGREGERKRGRDRKEEREEEGEGVYMERDMKGVREGD